MYHTVRLVLAACVLAPTTPLVSCDWEGSAFESDDPRYSASLTARNDDLLIHGGCAEVSPCYGRVCFPSSLSSKAIPNLYTSFLCALRRRITSALFSTRRHVPTAPSIVCSCSRWRASSSLGSGMHFSSSPGLSPSAPSRDGPCSSSATATTAPAPTNRAAWIPAHTSVSARITHRALALWTGVGPRRLAPLSPPAWPPAATPSAASRPCPPAGPTRRLAALAQSSMCAAARHLSRSRATPRTSACELIACLSAPTPLSAAGGRRAGSPHEAARRALDHRRRIPRRPAERPCGRPDPPRPQGLAPRGVLLVVAGAGAGRAGGAERVGRRRAARPDARRRHRRGCRGWRKRLLYRGGPAEAVGGRGDAPPRQGSREGGGLRLRGFPAAAARAAARAGAADAHAGCDGGGGGRGRGRAHTHGIRGLGQHARRGA